MRELRVEEGNLTDVLRRSLADRDAPTAVPVMAVLAGFWSVEGNHLKVVNVAGRSRTWWRTPTCRPAWTSRCALSSAPWS